MPTYILLMKLTEQGAKEAKEIPALIDQSVAAWEAMGGKTHSVHVTMGAYDYVAVGEGPSDEVAAAFALGLARQGRVTTTTLKGFSRDEIAAIVAKLP